MIIGSITITSLDPIGNAVANDTLIPVVNMSGVPTTQKMTVANLLHAGLGANLGNVANIVITGGTNGQYLQTDGAGNLSWTSGGGSGNGVVGGSNTQVQFNDDGVFGGNAGFTFDKTAGALTSPMIDTAAVYHLAGTVIENADLSHGATSALIIPENGNTTNPAQLNNFYGNVVIQSGTDANHLKGWTFDSTGTLNFPDNSGQGWPINQQRYGMGNLVAWLDGEWTIGEYAGNVGGATGIRIDPAIEGPVGMTFPSTTNASTQPVSIYSYAGSGIQLITGSNNWSFGSNGVITNPNSVYENSTNTVTCNPGAPTVILSSINSSIYTMKLIIQVEGRETSLNYDTQACEMLVVRSSRNNNVIGSVYGLTYTSNNPLATFNAAYNASTNMIDVTCTPTSAQESVYVRLTVTQITTSI